MSFDAELGLQRCRERLEKLHETDSAKTLPQIVADQSVSFYPRHWETRWPNGLMPRPTILNEKGKVSISRKELFKLGEKLDTDAEILEFYVNVCGWGCGTKAQSAARTAKPFELDPEGFVPKLRQGLETLKTEGPARAYWTLNNKPSNIKYLGPAFFTKLLYFADPSKKALILDRRVAESLGSKTKSGWTTKQYEEYLNVVERIRKQLDDSLRGDSIEYLLFQK